MYNRYIRDILKYLLHYHIEIIICRCIQLESWAFTEVPHCIEEYRRHFGRSLRPLETLGFWVK